MYRIVRMKYIQLQSNSIVTNSILQLCESWWCQIAPTFQYPTFCPTNGKHRFLCVSIIHETISMKVKNNKNVAPLSLILTVAKIHEMPISRLLYDFITHRFKKHLHKCYFLTYPHTTGYFILTNVTRTIYVTFHILKIVRNWP